VKAIVRGKISVDGKNPQANGRLRVFSIPWEQLCPFRMGMWYNQPSYMMNDIDGGKHEA